VGLRCWDSDGDPLTTSIVTGPAHGTLGAVDQASGTVVYTPSAGYSGTDSFTFTGSDATNAGSAAAATVMVAPPAVRLPFAAPPPGDVTHRRATPPPRLSQLHWLSGTQTGGRPSAGRQSITFSFVLNEAARVTLTFTRQVAGRAARRVALGALTLKGRAGHNRVSFDGRVPRHGLLPLGRITVTAVATTAGHRSAARRLSFVITHHRRLS
jgi:hypothetical protein